MALAWQEDRAMQGCNLSARQDSIKKRKTEMAAVGAAFSLFGELMR